MPGANDALAHPASASVRSLEPRCRSLVRPQGNNVRSACLHALLGNRPGGSIKIELAPTGGTKFAGANRS
ncbi:hypothetical protein D3C76_1108750 [compost metagenome]